MNPIKIFICFFFFLSLTVNVFAQEDLSKLLEETADSTKKEFVSSTFKGTRIINGQSVANVNKGVLQFQILHRFGYVNTGLYNFFGLDNASIRLGLDYGITDRLSVGYGRSSLNKAYDFYLKYQLIKQSTGTGSIPVTVVLYSDLSVNTSQRSTKDYKIKISNRLAYANQILIARKFSDKVSLQLTPTYIHRNVVETALDQNDVFAVGLGGRYKLTKRFALTGEYFYLLPGKTATDFANAFSLGFDIETGGHVFQIHITNGTGMIESQFIPATEGQWDKGDIQIGFNVSRVFTIVGKK